MIFKPVFLKYVFAGLILNGLGFVSFVALLEYFHFSPIMSASIQYLIIICIYYLTQTYFVFNKKANLENLIKFLLNIFFLYFLNICMFFVCIEIFNLNPIISQFYIMVMLILINYTVQKKIIYKFT